VQAWIARVGGEVAGVVELASQPGGEVEITIFGLVPEFVGRGFGGHLLTLAVRLAWAAEHPDGEATRRVWLHTSSRDHAHAQTNYEHAGSGCSGPSTVAGRSQPRAEPRSPGPASTGRTTALEQGPEPGEQAIGSAWLLGSVAGRDGVTGQERLELGGRGEVGVSPGFGGRLGPPLAGIHGSSSGSATGEAYVEMAAKA
jgi:acetyltransferase (GNAT) family protein